MSKMQPNISNLNPEQKTIRALSEAIVAAQRPIRILDAIKWDEKIKQDFFASGFKELPKVNHDYYSINPLACDPERKKEEFIHLEHEVRKRLGQFSGVSKIMQRMCREYHAVMDMLKHRGQKRFGEISQQLYGSTDDAFYANAPTLKDLADMIALTVQNIQHQADTAADIKKYDSEDAVNYLNKNLKKYFKDTSPEPIALISDDILADAAAGAEKIKIRRDVKFSLRNLKQLEVHEGWVHLGTTLNGKNQPICTFLSKGPPSSTITQEGLAIMMEIFTFTSYPRRVMRVNSRISAIAMAEQGADFIEVFNFFRDLGYSEEECYASSVRVFRGSTPTGLPFTKDLSYSKGFVDILNYIRLAIHKGLVRHLPMLFVGKTSLEDLRLIVDLVEEGLVVAPKYVPKQFSDPGPLCAWAAYSLFVNKLDPDHLAEDYRNLLRD